MEQKKEEEEACWNSSSFLQNHKGNCITAVDDDNLNKVFCQIKASKSSVGYNIHLKIKIAIPFMLQNELILQTVINYGASWCGVCNQISPIFCRLSKSFLKLSFVYADIDECPETTRHIRYTPTFHFYRDGERVDEMFGGGEDRLYDRLWLHS